jgi:hypothetical protein
MFTKLVKSLVVTVALVGVQTVGNAGQNCQGQSEFGHAVTHGHCQSSEVGHCYGTEYKTCGWCGGDGIRNGAQCTFCNGSGKIKVV